MKKQKAIKTTAAIALGVSAVTATAVPGTASAATYKLNAKKQLVKTSNGKLAKGNIVYKGKLYKNGKLAKAKRYTLVGSGSKLQLFYGPTLKKGYKTAQNKTYLFKDGKLAKGTVQAGGGERFYENGKLAKGYDVVTGKDGEKSLYQNGYLKKGLKTATRNSVTQLYKDGKLAEGTILFKNVLYTAGDVSKGLAEYEGTFYNNGKLANGEVDGAEYKNGVLTATKEEVSLKKATAKTEEAKKALADAVETKDAAKIEEAAKELVAQATAQAAAAQAVAEKATTTAGVETAQKAIKSATEAGTTAVAAAQAAGKTIDAKALDAAVEAANKAVDANDNKPETPTEPETPTTPPTTPGNGGGNNGGGTTPEETEEQKAVKAVAAGTATAAQYKTLVGAEVVAEQVTVLNAYFKATQEATPGATVPTTITKELVKTQADALTKATAETLEAAVHAGNSDYVKYTPVQEAGWDFSASTKGSKSIIEGTKAWFNNGAVNKATEGEWENFGTVEQGIKNDADENSKAYNVKKENAVKDTVVYVLTTEDKWVKVTLKAEPTLALKKFEADYNVVKDLTVDAVKLENAEDVQTALTSYEALTDVNKDANKEAKIVLDQLAAKLADLKFVADVKNAKSGDTVELTKDITLNEALTVPEGVVVNGGGHTITINTVATEKALSGIGLSTGSTLQNVTVQLDASKTKWADNLVEVLENAQVTLKDVTIENGTQAALTLLSNSKATLQGNIALTNNAWGGIEVYNNATLTLDDAVKVNYTAAELGTPFAWVDAAVAPGDVEKRVTDKDNVLADNRFVTSDGKVQHFWNIAEQVVETQETAMAAAGTNTMNVTTNDVTFTFENDLSAKAITNTEKFLDEVVQFGVPFVYRVNQTPTKLNKTNANANKLKESADLTTEEVSTILATERNNNGSLIEGTELNNLGGWSTTIDWSKVQLTQGKTKKEIVMTINPELIKAADLANPDKINSGAFVNPGEDKSYNMAFYKKGDITVKYKIALKPENDKAVATFVAPTTVTP